MVNESSVYKFVIFFKVYFVHLIAVSVHIIKCACIVFIFIQVCFIKFVLILFFILMCACICLKEKVHYCTNVSLTLVYTKTYRFRNIEHLYGLIKKKKSSFKFFNLLYKCTLLKYLYINVVKFKLNKLK